MSSVVGTTTCRHSPDLLAARIRVAPARGRGGPCERRGTRLRHRPAGAPRPLRRPAAAARRPRSSRTAGEDKRRGRPARRPVLTDTAPSAWPTPRPSSTPGSPAPCLGPATCSACRCTPRGAPSGPAREIPQTRGPRIERRLEMLERFVSQAALALTNARLLAQVRALAAADGLTGVANRRTFDTRLAAEVKRSVRSGARLRWSCSTLTTSSGSTTPRASGGDETLQRVAATLQAGHATWTSSPATAARSSPSCSRSDRRRRVRGRRAHPPGDRDDAGGTDGDREPWRS